MSPCTSRASSASGHYGGFTRKISRVAGLLGIACVLVAGGCAALPIAAIGDVLGAASSAASGGSEVYSLGKLDDVFAADFDSCNHAAVAAANELWLRDTIDQMEQAKQPTRHFRFVDLFGAKLDVTIEQRSEHLCRVRVNVGWFGSEPTSKLFMDRLRAHLPAEASVRKV